MKLFAGITKVDEAKRIVMGRAVQEVIDRADEIFDYEKSKPHFQDWSKSFSDDTDGKSLGNIRAMHGKTAAGKVTQIDFNDTEKAIDISAKIVDDNEWKKVLEGVYTGFSIGGSYVGEHVTEKFDGRDIRRYVAKPSEISIVDSPCIPTAKFFEVVKANGAVEKVAFKPADIQIVGTAAEVDEFTKLIHDSGKTMGDVLAVMKREIDKKVVEKTDTEKAIEAAMVAGDLKKRLNDPELAFVDLNEIAKAQLTTEELAACKTLEQVKAAIITKAGAMSAANKDRLQAAHDHLAAMGADCDGDKDKAVSGDLKKIATELDDTKARLAKLEALPMPHPIALRAIKKEDVTKKDGDKTDDNPLLAKPYEWLVKMADGVTVDWDASKLKLEQAAA